ncbi:unnamed protein product, partial [Owenia fusiformis]
RGLSTDQVVTTGGDTEANKNHHERHDSKSKKGTKSRERSNEKSSKIEKLKKILSPKSTSEKHQSANDVKPAAGKHKPSIQHKCDRCEVPNSNLLGCEFCDLWFCNSCENLDENDLALLNASTNGTHWYCHECEPQVRFILEQAKSGIVNVAKSVAHSLESIKKNQSQTNRNVESVSTKVKNLQDLYNNVILKIDTLNDSVNEINLEKGAVEKSLKEVA